MAKRPRPRPHKRVSINRPSIGGRFARKAAKKVAKKASKKKVAKKASKKKVAKKASKKA